jgi:hypothetical protein
VRACKRLSDVAKTLSKRDHVKGIRGKSTPLNNLCCGECSEAKDQVEQLSMKKCIVVFSCSLVVLCSYHTRSY